ncbi:MAG: site-specific integrase [Prolixibacteraceae bacterium]
MINLTYYIDISKKDKNEESPILANVTTNYIKTSYRVGKVKSRHWNKTKQRVSPPRITEEDNNHEEINSHLDKLQTDSKKYFLECRQNKIEITPGLVKDFFNGIKVDSNPTKKDFWEAYDEYLKIGELEKAANTIRNRKTIKNKLKDFETETGYKMNFESINLVFYDKLKEWVLITKNHDYNYLSAISDKFKAFMNWSHEREYHNTTTFKKFSAPEKEGSIIHLTYSELKHLVNFDFKNIKHQKARDFFCFGCLTGLRYCDLQRLTKDNISNGSIKITTQKTNKEVTIPIIQEQQTIIDKYPEPYKLLPKFSNQKLNKYVKECCKIAEIKTPTEWKTFEKNITKTEYKPKHELIGTHTARKTFINLAYTKGVPIETIKAITGITREKTLKRYLEVSGDTKKENLILAFGGL